LVNAQSFARMAGSSNVPSWKLFVAGAIGGIVETIVVQPLDFVKTRLQLNEGSNQWLFKAMRSVIKEGGLLRFYRGLLPELVGNLPTTSVMLSTAEIAKRFLTEQNGGVCNTYIAAISGIVSGYAESIVTTPFQVVKVRMQAKEHLGSYANSVHCLNRIIKTEGISAFMIGLGPSFWRNCSWNSVYFACLYKIKKSLPTATTTFGDVLSSLVAGSVSGGVACCVYAPFDVIKSRFQSQVYEPGVKPKYRQYTLQTIRYIWKHEGLGALYKGLTPALVRMIVGGGVMVGTFEFSCHMLL